MNITIRCGECVGVVGAPERGGCTTSRGFLKDPQEVVKQDKGAGWKKVWLDPPPRVEGLEGVQKTGCWNQP